MSPKNLYFPNLNGLRFIAAFLVIIHHIEQNKSIFNLPSIWNLPAVELIGKLGVVLFFALSGFLITYLLLQEKVQTNTISIKDFYKRRILRIWPLYYLIVVMGLFILPHIEFISMNEWKYEMYRHFEVKTLMFVFFMPNLALSVFPRIPYVAQAWSIGVEEQFYFMWPFLVKKFKNIRRMLIFVIAVYVLIKFSLFFAHVMYPDHNLLTKVFTFWYYNFTIDCMAFGGLAAYILFKNKWRIMRFIFNKYFQIVLYATTISFLILGMRFPRITNEVYAFLFSIIILNLAGNKNSIVNIENKWMNYLGKISYGLYMYHILMSAIAIKVLIAYHFENNFAIYILSFILSFAVSALSYEFFEKKFIKAKVKYSTVVSGDNAKNNISKKNDDIVAAPKPGLVEDAKKALGMLEPEYKD